MGVGLNIRNIRILRGMTQKELGVKAGFSPSTADVRIRQYESEKMVPKEDKLKAIANALDVDVSAFTDHSIKSFSDIMHIFFELEKNFGLVIDKDANGKVCLSFDEKHHLGHYCNARLDNWYKTYQTLIPDSSKPGYEHASKDYQLWKCRYPLDLFRSESAAQAAIDEKYQELLYDVKSNLNLRYVSDFITIFEKLLETGFDIKISKAPERQDSHTLVCSVSFRAIQIMTSRENASVAYAQYLAALEQLENLGVIIERTGYTLKDEYLSTTYFYNTVLTTVLNSVVIKMIMVYNSGDFDDELSRMEYENDLQHFHIPIVDTI